MPQIHRERPVARTNLYEKWLKKPTADEQWHSQLNVKMEWWTTSTAHVKTINRGHRGSLTLALKAIWTQLLIKLFNHEFSLWHFSWRSSRQRGVDSLLSTWTESLLSPRIDSLLSTRIDSLQRGLIVYCHRGSIVYCQRGSIVYCQRGSIVYYTKKQKESTMTAMRQTFYRIDPST